MTTFINFAFSTVVPYVFFPVLFTFRLKFLVHFNLLNVCLMCNKVVIVVVVVCKCRSCCTIDIPLLSCFFYQEPFCLFDPNYRNDENNNDDDDDVSITTTIFFSSSLINP